MEETKKKTPGRKKKEKKNVQNAVAHIKATFNNTMVTITDMSGDVIAWSTAGGQGFKGSRKSTPFAARSPRRTRPRRPWNMVSARWKSWSKAPA